MNTVIEFDHPIFALLKQPRERQPALISIATCGTRVLSIHCQRIKILLLLKKKKKGLNGDWNPDLRDAGAVLHPLSYQTKWEQVVVWIDYKPVDVEIGDGNTRICI